MNVYDFDKTIFYPDSTFLFVMYCWFHHPLKMLKHFPAFFVMSIKMVFHKATTKEMKEKLLARFAGGFSFFGVHKCSVL